MNKVKINRVVSSLNNIKLLVSIFPCHILNAHLLYNPTGLLSAYRVRYILNRQLNVNKPDTEQKWSVVYVTHNANLSEYTADVVGLAKMEYYMFEVSANNTADMGWGQAGACVVYTIDRRAAPEPPSQPVVGKSSVKADEVTVSWSPGADNYGPARFFSVHMMEMAADREGLVNVSGWRCAVDKFFVDSSRSSYMLKIGGTDQNGNCIFVFISNYFFKDWKFL